MIQIVFGLVLLLGSSLAVFAGETPQWKETQAVEESIHKKIHQIVSVYDSRAVIFVNAQMKQSELMLPSTPFVYKGLSVSNEDQTIRLQKIDAKIYTEKASLPEPVLDMLKMALKSYAVVPTIEVLPLPQELSRGPASDLVNSSDPIGSWMMNPWIQLLMAAVFLAFGLIPALSSFFNRRNNTQLVQHLESVIQRTMESFAENGGSGLANFERAGAQNPAYLPAGANNAGLQNISLSAEGFKALLMDCYWNHLDGYAAFVWQNMPVDIRGLLLSNTKGLVDYVRFISGLEPVNLGYHDDPTYLRPLALHHLNQESLSQWAQINPKHLKHLSRIRFEHLEIPAKEKIRLLNATESSDIDSTLDSLTFERMPASSLRQLQVALPITIKDTAEEKELVASMKGLSPQAKSRIVSLAWLLEIPKDKAQEILQSFTARDLATVWLAPDDVLLKLEAYLPERKLRLMKDYMKTVKPNRKSPVFQALHAQVMRHLTNPTKTEARVAAQ